MTTPFGLPITEDTVGALSRYHGKKVITQDDCAREAMRLIHAEGKNLDALDHAWKLKENYGNGMSTLVLVYNATGARVTLEQRHDWQGYVYRNQPPPSMHNGQWISFLHVGTGTASRAGRVFRGRDKNGKIRDFVVAWFIPLNLQPTAAYTEIGDQDAFTGRWPYVGARLHTAKRITRASDHNCASTVSIDGYTTSQCIAVLQHNFEPIPSERDDPAEWP
ncbi:23 kDa jasmonate-induced protein-like [Triticum dicoccoides]|uniref:23 kDa jasmonate-induced protein-like n=1 Tax=Triticum dicoccoides TaxID=85692 RepID=UPI001890BFD6|nr:23 kDa jasmonate-induced protein-like [Triticum dicoccoides]